MNSKRLLIGFVVLAMIVLGCRGLVELPELLDQAPSPSATTTAPRVPEWSPTALPASPVPTKTSERSSGEVEIETAEVRLPADAFDVDVHPEGGLIAGDFVSFEVIARGEYDLTEPLVTVFSADGQPVAEARFSQFGIAGRTQATMLWVWDTRQLEPGFYQLTFTVSPGDLVWKESFQLLPPDSLPLALRHASWDQAQTACCLVHYITGTAADRDLEELLQTINMQAERAANRMGVGFDDPITISILPRVLGHGGFANDEIHISYLDRNYAGGQVDFVLHHEMIHTLDTRLGGELRPSILVEGLAVYLTGGHFKSEPLMPRAAALLSSWGNPEEPGLGWYIPLRELAGNFYGSQHEIGYLQAGALVEFMVQTWGWDAFSGFYRSIPDKPSQPQAMDEALQQHFFLTLEELERQFLDALMRQQADAGLMTDVRLTVQFYDSVRRYQVALDPSAYFMTAWLLDTADMRQRGIVADYLRHPSAFENLVFEVLLAAAADDLKAGLYQRAEVLIQAVNDALDAVDFGEPDPFASNPITADYAAVTFLVNQNPGWVNANLGNLVYPERVWIDGSSARVWIALDDGSLQELFLERDNFGDWAFMGEGVTSSGN